MNREAYWNIRHGIIIDILAILIMIVVVLKILKIFKNINKNKDFDTENIILFLKNFYKKEYFKKFIIYGIFNPKLFKKIFSGIGHFLLFWGMTFLFIGTILVLFNVLFNLPVFLGNFNIWFMSFSLDAAGLAAVIGVIILISKRIFFPGRLNLPEKANGFILIQSWILIVLVTGFVVEGLRISALNLEPGSFVGNFLSNFFVEYNEKKLLHQFLWWVHGFLAILLVAYIPFSKLSHIFLIPLNAVFSDLKNGNDMEVTNFELLENEEDISVTNNLPILGVSKLKDFSSKNLLDFASCIGCGRCHEVCPAVISGKELSPKEIVTELQKMLFKNELESDFIENTKIEFGKIFSCTTCSLCKTVCPAYINQPQAIMLTRQYFTMEKAHLPEIMSKAHNSLEKRKNPFYNSISGGNEWKEGLNIEIFERGKTEYLLWVGCAIAYEERNQGIARSFVNILNKANVSYGILENYTCLGDPARQMGDDFMFSEIAKSNIKEFKSKNIDKIITMCPHCYDTLKKYYPQLGGNYKVYHHTEIIYELINSGKITPKKTKKIFTYHDPCYLSRYNDFYTIPRNIIKSIGVLREMKRNKKNSFCCGGGGGGYWMEESGKRMNQIRAEEAIQLNVDIMLTACPFCLLMLTDGSKKYTDKNFVFDIAEMIDLYS